MADLRRKPLPSTPVNSSFRRCLGLAGYRSPGHHSQSRRVAHSTNTTHQYIAIADGICSFKTIASLSEVPNKAYPRTITGSLSGGKASVKKGEVGIALNTSSTATSQDTYSVQSGEQGQSEGPRLIYAPAHMRQKRKTATGAKPPRTRIGSQRRWGSVA